MEIKSADGNRMKLEDFNALTTQKAAAELMKCNTSQNWCDKVAVNRPYENLEALLEGADNVWQKSEEVDLLQAFEGHPEIGDVSTLRKKYRNTEKLAGHEQSGVNTASENTLHLLAHGNHDYKEKFGFIFIVCATGKNAGEMLELLQDRLPNTREQELANAAEEQRKITHIRIEKLIA